MGGIDGNFTTQLYNELKKNYIYPCKSSTSSCLAHFRVAFKRIHIYNQQLQSTLTQEEHN